MPAPPVPCRTTAAGTEVGWDFIVLARSADVVAGARVERLPHYCSSGVGAAAKDDAEEEVAAPGEPASRDSQRRCVVWTAKKTV
jgi:hypothetical protein